MSTSLLYHTQGITGFQFPRFDYSGGVVHADIVRKKGKLSCPSCGSFDVKVIGIDEFHMGRTVGKRGYLTIVRDLDSGAVLHVDKGKGMLTGMRRGVGETRRESMPLRESGHWPER